METGAHWESCAHSALSALAERDGPGPALVPVSGGLTRTDQVDGRSPKGGVNSWIAMTAVKQ